MTSLPVVGTKYVGLPWLSDVPGTWSVLRAKNVFRIVDERSGTGEEELLTVSANDGVRLRSEKAVSMFKAESYIGHKLCWPGDLVINSLWAWMQGLGFTRHHGLVSSAYSVYRPVRAFADYVQYFNYLLRSGVYKWELMTRSKGVWISRLQLSDAAFLDMPIVLPPPDEQAAIVRFLDHYDRRIQRAIRAKQRLIALLNEQKHAIIQRAVTRGLDPDVPMRDSGVEWLGEVPAHWEVRPLRRLCRSLGGGTPDRTRPDYWGGTLPWVSPKDMKRAVLADAQEHVSDLAVDRSAITVIAPGAVLVVVRGMILARTFPVAMNSVPVTINQDMKGLVPTTVLGSAFLAAYLTGISRVVVALANQAAHGTKKLESRDLFGLPVPVPPPAEQKAICTTVASQTAAADGLIDRAEREIGLLREYRTRLIADVVTGRVDVREAAAGLGEEHGDGEDWGDDLAADDPDESNEAEPEEAEI